MKRVKPTGSPSTRAAHTPLAFILIALGAAAAPRPAAAQDAAEKDVVSVVQRFFQGMLARDAAMLESTVADETVLMSAEARDGRTIIHAIPISQFINGVIQRKGEPANERIYSPRVQVDGDLAHVWAFYTLHIGDRFSHCGYDSFQLLRTEAGWKIAAIADSRRTANCEPPGG